MNSPGIGATLHYLSGGSRESAGRYYGRKIVAASMVDDVLAIKFDDGVTLQLSDQGQSCCEHRYMTCDDDLSKLAGGKLTKIEVREIKKDDTTGEPHEQAFVEIATDDCFITVCTHNEHNGYYGGFGLDLREAP